MNRSLTLLVVLLFSIIGCASEKAWVYAPNKFLDTAPLSRKTAAVLPFEDARENLNSNKFLLYMIPIVPFGWQDLNAPEGTPVHLTSAMWMNYKPTEDFAKALATELQNARVFEESHFDYGRGSADIVVRGKILNTKYQSKIISYGLSVYGPLLWLFGLPAGTFSNDLAVQLECVDAKSNRTIFSKTYEVPTYGKTVWIYSQSSDFNYADLLKDVNKRFIEDLRGQSASLASAKRDVTFAM